MSTDRIARINELLKRSVAEFLYREMTESEFAPATVTVTRVLTSSDLHSARVFVSVLGDETHRDRMLNLLKQHRKNIQRHIASEIKIKYTPHLKFVADPSLAEGDRVLQLLNDLDVEEDEDEPRPE